MRPDELQERIRAILTARSWQRENECPAPEGAIVEVILTGRKGTLRWPDARARHGYRSVSWYDTPERDPVTWVDRLYRRYVCAALKASR